MKQGHAAKLRYNVCLREIIRVNGRFWRRKDTDAPGVIMSSCLFVRIRMKRTSSFIVEVSIQV